MFDINNIWKLIHKFYFKESVYFEKEYIMGLALQYSCVLDATYIGTHIS